MENYAIELRLQQWAGWTISFLQNTIGFQSESTIAKFQKEGFLIHENMARTSSLPYNNPLEEEINQLFNILKEEDFSKAEAIWVFYVAHLNVKKFVEDTKITRSAFYKRLRAAKKWFNQRL